MELRGMALFPTWRPPGISHGQGHFVRLRRRQQAQSDDLDGQPRARAWIAASRTAAVVDPRSAPRFRLRRRSPPRRRHSRIALVWCNVC